MPKTATYPEPWRPGAATATSATAGCEQGAQHNRCKRRMCLSPTNLAGSGSYLHGIWHACAPSFSINCDVVETSGWSYQLTRNRGTKVARVRAGLPGLWPLLSHQEQVGSA